MTRRRVWWLRLAAVSALSGLLFWLGRTLLAADETEQAPATEVIVEVGQITRATLRAFVVAYGMVEPESSSMDRPAASARIASPVAGVIATAHCVEGERVEKGAELFRLDSRVVDVAVAKAQAAVDFAEKALARQQRLLTAGGASLKQVQEAQQQVDVARNELANARAQRALQTITAPLAGTVVRVNVKPGEAVDLSTVLAEIIDLDRLVVAASVPSAELPALRIGQPVLLAPDRAASTDSDPAPIAPLGMVAFIGSQVDPKTDTAPVRMSIPSNAGLRPGQFVSVRIVSDERRDRLTVPVGSVVKTADGPVIAVVEGDRAIQRPVKVGLRDGDLVEVSGDGLTPGTPVVTKGAYGLPKETKIRVLGGAAAPASYLDLKQTITLPGVRGSLDLMAADIAGQRVFVAAQDNHTLEVIDLRSGQRTHSVGGLNEPKGILYHPDSQRIYVSTAGDGRVTVLDSASFAVITTIGFKEKANNLRFDPASGQLFVGVGKSFGALGIVDTARDVAVGEIGLESAPKQFEVDGNFVYANIPATGHVAVVQRDQQAVVTLWSVKGSSDNVPMALDRTHHHLFSGCEPGKLIVFDTGTGEQIAAVDINPGSDGISYDSVRRLVYVSCGEGSIDVVRETATNDYQRVGRIPTTKGASTSLFVPELDRFFLAVPGGDTEPAAVRVYQPL